MLNSFDLLGIIIDAAQKAYVRPLLDKLAAYDRESYIHSIYVAVLSVQIGAEYGLSENRLKFIAQGALLHNVGNIFIPLEILHKPDELTEEEYEIIKSHPVRSYELAKSCGVPKIPLMVCLMHHFHIDGSGYPSEFPYGIDSMRIPTEAQIVTTADIFAAIISPRTYRGSKQYVYAIGEMYRCVAAGKLDVRFVKVLEELVVENRLLLNTGLTGPIV